MVLVITETNRDIDVHVLRYFYLYVEKLKSINLVKLQVYTIYDRYYLKCMI